LGVCLGMAYFAHKTQGQALLLWDKGVHYSFYIEDGVPDQRHCCKDLMHIQGASLSTEHSAVSQHAKGRAPRTSDVGGQASFNPIFMSVHGVD